MWGNGIPPLNEPYRRLFDGIEGVHFVGKLPRQELVDLELSSDILAYPNCPAGQFAELFGVTVAETQVAGCVPVTSAFGAFPTTVICPEGVLITDHDGYPLHPQEHDYAVQFCDTIINLLRHRPELERRQELLSRKASERFNYSAVARQWLTAIYAHK
jgi:glycosyltransferase involved in cell wall biosynthesis